jgi:hypothetical protein
VGTRLKVRFIDTDVHKGYIDFKKIHFRRQTMSKYMQLTVTVRPYYQKDLDSTYPRLASNLRHLDPDLANRNPSLYELVGQLDHILYRFEGTPLREVLLGHRETLRNLHKSIEDSIANWNLAQADQLLYGIEDTFDEIESELD